MNKKIITLIILLASVLGLYAQNDFIGNSGLFEGQLTVGSDSIHSSAQLEISSTNRGMLIPRLTTIQRDAIIAPATSLLIFNLTTNAYEFFNGTIWIGLGGITTETDPVFTVSPAFNVINTGVGSLFLADDGTYKAAGADGNGIFDIANNNGIVPSGFTTNLTDKWQINGNVGIGVNPLEKLHVNGNTRIDGQVQIGWLNNSVAIGTTVNTNYALLVNTNRPNLFRFQQNTGGLVRLSLSTGGVLNGVNLAHQSRFYLGTPTSPSFTSAQIAIKGSTASYSIFTEGSVTGMIGLAVNNNGAVSVGGNANSNQKFTIVNNINTTEILEVFANDLSTVMVVNDANKNVAIGTNTGNPSAKLDITSTTQGLLFPRMTTTQKNAIVTPSAGLQVYDITLNQMSYYNGTIWINF